MTAILTCANISSAPRNLALLEKTLFAFSIGFSGMSRTISISWEKLGFTGESLQLLKKSGVKLSNISVFSQLDEYALQLGRKRAEIEQRTLYLNQQRVVTENQINLALEEYQELTELADELRSALRHQYVQGQAEFRERVAALMATPEFRIPSNIQAEKVDLVCQSFISNSQIDELLRVRLEVYRIPSLEEQLIEQSQLKEELNRYRNAQRQEEAEIALQNAQAESLERSRNLRLDIYAKAKAEIEQIIAEQIAAIAKYEPEAPDDSAKADAHFKRNRKIREKLAAHIKRMEVLSEIGIEGNVEVALSQLENLNEAITSSSPQSPLSLESQLASLQEDLRNNLKSIQSPETPELEEAPYLF